jgi:hypothetical protein
MSMNPLNLSAIENAFEQQPRRVFSPAQISSVFKSCPLDWNLPRSMDERRFIKMLLRRTQITQVKLASSDYPSLVRYVWGKNATPAQLALSIRPNSYCSHGSAMWIHGVGGDERHLFINSEQSVKPPNRSTMTQEGIDRAFSNNQRTSKLVYRVRGTTIVVLSGKNSGRLEVHRTKTPSGDLVDVTSLERTLVDITVRPTYAGGVASVLNAFRMARGKVSVEKLVNTIKALDYSYPYHQSVGFYLKTSGYGDAALDLVRKMGTRFNFYLGHGMSDQSFDDEFKVFFPTMLR